MAARFVPIDRDTPLLRPPNLRDRVPADHLVHFIMDAVAALDLRQVKVFKRGPRGTECFNRQVQFYQSGRGHVERLFVLPFGGQARRVGRKPPRPT